LDTGYELVDRHAGKGTTVIRIKFANGHKEENTFDQFGKLTSHFAYGLEQIGFQYGDKVAIVVEASNGSIAT
jgi:long-subunit acyl-CoA synthetase (AMP-forming)